MNTKITALTLAAATAFSIAAKPALAGDKEVALIGGLIGGAIIASAISDHGHDSRVVVTSGYGYDNRRDDNCNDGYWKTVEVRTWVPGYWVSERRHGRSDRYFVAGHYETRFDRVWVASNRYDRRDDRHDRYSYDNRRDYRR